MTVGELMTRIAEARPVQACYGQRLRRRVLMIRTSAVRSGITKRGYQGFDGDYEEFSLSGWGPDGWEDGPIPEHFPAVVISRYSRTVTQRRSASHESTIHCDNR